MVINRCTAGSNTQNPELRALNLVNTPSSKRVHRYFAFQAFDAFFQCAVFQHLLDSRNPEFAVVLIICVWLYHLIYLVHGFAP